VQACALRFCCATEIDDGVTPAKISRDRGFEAQEASSILGRAMRTHTAKFAVQKGLFISGIFLCIQSFDRV
jgi:hypothetical protein